MRQIASIDHVTTPTRPSPDLAATASAQDIGVPPGRLARTAGTALAPAVWGTTYAVTTELLPAGHPLFAGLARSLPAGLIALAIAGTLPRSVWWAKAAVLGVLNIGIFIPLLFVAAEHLPGGVAATIVSGQPLIVALLAVPMLSERLSAWRLSWAATGMVGVGIVVIGPEAALDPVGVLSAGAAAMAMATGVVLTKRWGRPAYAGPTAFAGWQLTGGGLFILPLTLILEGSPPTIDASALLGYVWLGLPGALIAYVLWFRGIGSLPVTATALLALLSPLVATVLGVLLLDEQLGAVQLLGFALTLTALSAGQLDPGRLRWSRNEEVPR